MVTLNSIYRHMLLSHGHGSEEVSEQRIRESVQRSYEIRAAEQENPRNGASEFAWRSELIRAARRVEVDRHAK